MQEEQIKKIFRYTNKRFAHFNELNKGCSPFLFRSLELVFVLLRYIGIYYLLSRIIHVWYLKLGLSDIEKAHIVLTRNQFLAANKLCQLGVSYPIVGMGYTTSCIDYKLSQKKILTAIFLNWKNLRLVFYLCRKYDIVSKNNLRMLNILGILNILDYFRNLKVAIKYNDHGPHSTLLYDRLKEKGIPTVFVQHATTGRFMPKELYHDINYLWSRSSVEHYSEVKYGCQVVTGADFRLLDTLKKAKKYTTKKKLLIAFNKIDDIESIRKCIVELKQVLTNVAVVLRPHPADQRKLDGFDDVEISIGRPIEKDLAEARWVLSNESNIALEAIILGRFFYKCAFFSKHIDNYGFFKKGLIIKYFDSISELITSIGNDETTFNSEKLSYFTGNLNEIRASVKVLEMKIDKL